MRPEEFQPASDQSRVIEKKLPMKSLSLRLMLCSIFFALLLTACAPSAPTPQPPTPLPAEQTDAAHAPVILRVEERTENQNGQLLLYKDIYFTDPDGDAIILVNKLVSTDPEDIPARFADDPITVPVDEQKRTGLITISIGCRVALNPYSYTTEDRIRDAAGNLSEPATVIFACPANPPNSIPSVIFELVLGVGLLTGFWLSFRKRPAEGKPAILSILLLFCSLFPMGFMFSILHEGGHALANLILGKPVWSFYVHPFTFSAFVRPFIDNLLLHAMGYITNLLVSFVIFCLFWKRRSVATLPFVMLFPFGAIGQGLLMLLLNGDTANILRLTGLPAFVFIGLGLVLVFSGLLLFLALFPLLGLAPGDRKSLLIVPAAFFLQSISGWLISHLFVPGSSFALHYFSEGIEIIESANTLAIVLPTLSGLFAVIYVTLFRKINPRLPVWLQTETASLTWKDLRIPAVIAVICVIVGLIIIT